ncbi:uncharacterized protein V6R79_001374 [Siganus canaliculatus]
MKMSPLLYRVVSVWLCIAVVCWSHCDYVDCTELHPEAQRAVSSQDVSSEEKESWEKAPDGKLDESLTLPALIPSESEQLMEENQQKDEQVTQELGKMQHSEAFEVEESATEPEFEVEKGLSQLEPEPEPILENPLPETSITQEMPSSSLIPSHDPFPFEVTDTPVLTAQDNTPNSLLVDASEVLSPDIADPDHPPVDCEEETNPYDSDSPPIVLENTSNVHTAGTKIHSDPPLNSPAAHGTQHLESNTSHMLEEPDLSSPGATDTDSSVSTKDPEDIPTFDEWKRKVMEVEKEKTQSSHTSNNGASHVVKKVQKNFNNYASVECGAKILGANSEAKSTSAILMENMDLYMLNPCSNKIWFIIELCEPIQLKQLDIANFELFSSTPKDFLVSISDRYPTNKWLKLGTFHGRDERTVQSFPLDEHLYAKYVKMFTKYIKVELLSHFGSEHFCPLSLIRVFGTSMVEEYEEIADPSERPDEQDDDLDYPPGYAPGEDKLSNNLIGSAKDVILNMVNNIAVNVLGGGPEMEGNHSSMEVNETELSQEIETTTLTTTTTTTADVPSVSDSEGEEMLDPDVTATEPSSPEPPLPEMPGADTSEEELPPVEEKIVTPLEKDEEEHIGPTITLLEKEEELEEEKEKEDVRWQQQEIPDCSLLPSSSSSCSCAASLQEYLLWQCSALPSTKRKCQTVNRRKTSSPIHMSTWDPALSPSACPETQHQHIEVHQPHEKQQAPEQKPESPTSLSETLQPTGTTAESVLEHLPLEPSQTSSLLKPVATDSSSANPTPVVKTAELCSEKPAQELAPEKSQDVLAEEQRIEPSTSLSSSLVSPQPSSDAALLDASVAPAEEKSDADVPPQIKSPDVTIERMEQSQVPLPATTLPDPVAVPEGGEQAHLEADLVTEPEPSGGLPVIPEIKSEDFVDDLSALSPSPSAIPSSLASPSLSDIYADPPNGTEQNGNPVHGSSQKESVFMRLNNRIKALEMNMSLSGRYLEQLSQRYRKQMEEMQKAFNKTIIKLQNTSRIAEEQDQRQTESIQFLQGQLENVTQLVLNLSITVSQLQIEVSDRQNYLLMSLALCLFLGLLLCANHCRITTAPPTTEPEPPLTKSYSYCCPERQFTSGDEAGLKRSASYPLICSESFQLATTEGPDILHAEDTHSLCPANRKRRRRKMKPVERVETLKPSLHAATELCNRGVVCNGVSINPIAHTKRLLQPMFRDSPSEGSSEGSSHSDDPSFCGITTACTRICDGLPPAKSRAEKRASRRRQSKPSLPVVSLLQAPRRNDAAPISTIHDLMNRKTEQSSGTFGVNVPLSGPV